MTARALLIIAILLIAAGCARPITMGINNSMVAAMSAAAPIVTDLHRADGAKAIDAATSVEGVRIAEKRVNEKWAPVWAALRSFAVVQNEVAAAIDAKELTIAYLDRFRAAYCAVRAMLGEYRDAVLPTLGCAK